ncbi:MAG: ubiquinone/menaquinone biosynthesis methyltransferase [Bacteriovoracaceae bacterium]|nr:ubiquinone/menaquinone biosynthesis methyltransferase [Bacteriovoracaceae bacterium]
MSVLFDGLAKSYDKANIFFSFGFDYYWRKRLIDYLPTSTDSNHIDVACGTGAIIKRTAKKFTGNIVGVDISKDMLKIANARISAPNVKMEHGDGQALTFKDDSFDVLTNGFGLRNFPDFRKGLKESHRVLKKGGQAFFLDFQMPKNIILKKLFRFYLHKIMPVLGGMISKDKAGWIYLGASIEYFSENIDLESEMKRIGFVEVKNIPMTFGVVSVFIGKKDEPQALA